MTLTAETFTPFIGKSFQAGPEAPTLTLVEVDATQRLGWEHAPRQPFSLILRGARDTVLPEGTYEFTVDGRHRFELHVAPVHTPMQTHQDYQIVFN